MEIPPPSPPRKFEKIEDWHGADFKTLLNSIAAWSTNHILKNHVSSLVYFCGVESVIQSTHVRSYCFSPSHLLQYRAVLIKIPALLFPATQAKFTLTPDDASALILSLSLLPLLLMTAGNNFLYHQPLLDFQAALSTLLDKILSTSGI